jgi:hypothetical protein
VHVIGSHFDLKQGGANFSGKEGTRCETLSGLVRRLNTNYRRKKN